MIGKSIFERRFLKCLEEDVTVGGALGGSEGLEGGSVGNTDTDSYATGDQRVPASIFSGVIKRDGMAKCKKCKGGKKCKACKKREEDEEEVIK